MGSLLANPLTVLFVGFQVLGIGVAQGAVLLNVLRPMVQGVTLVFYDVFWRACDWYTNRARAHNLHVRTNARACAHAQAHAALRIFKDCYFCIGGSRCPQSTLTIRNFSLSLSLSLFLFSLCACGGERGARIRAHWRAHFRTYDGLGDRINRVPLSRSSGTFSIVCKVWTL